VSARRFFIEGVHRAGDRVALEGGDARKIVSVLRLQNGAELELVDSAGALFTARLELDGERVGAHLVSQERDEEANGPIVDVAQAVPKGQKMDFVVEKATELGARAILPFYSERTVVTDVGASKVERWRRVAKAAAAQCGRRTVPAVEQPVSFGSLLRQMQEYDVVLFPWELAERRPVAATLAPLLDGAGRVLVVVGPEGGFTHDEADAARRQGARVIWLGRRILRTETAAMAVLAILGAFGE
jgi:16S rRNA (uracil1498-N3)-methyltransferase